MAKEQTVYDWLKDNLGKQCLAPLTSTDRLALEASVAIVKLLGYSRDRDLLAAYGIVVSRMQHSTQELAYHAIAFVLDWPDRSKIWAAAGVKTITNPRTCKYE